MRDERIWPRVWFARYCLMLFLPLFLLLAVVGEEKGQFLVLSLMLLCFVLQRAWLTVDGHIGKGWRIGLVTSLLLLWAYCAGTIFAMGGDTRICFPRYEKPHIWETAKPAGHGVWCDGIPLEEL